MKAVASGPPADEKYDKRTKIEFTKCLNLGEFTFVLKDLGKDGMCCSFGEGGLNMTVDGEVVGQMSGEEPFEEKQFVFVVAVGSDGISEAAISSETTTSSTTSNTELTTTTTTISTTESTEDVLANSTEFAIGNTTQDWTNFDYAHTKFCGPKVVGGYDIAIAQCGPSTMCGLSTSHNQYGSSGNDCPKDQDLMCYADISCGNGPGATLSDVSTVNVGDEPVTSSGSTANEGDEPSTEAAAVDDGANADSTLETNDNSGTKVNSTITNIMTVTKRGSFCGTSYLAALANCSPDAHCSTDDDCTPGTTCFSGISCTYSTNIATGEIIGNEDVVSSVMEEYSGTVRSGIGFCCLIGLCMIGIGGLF
jgi:hypothetical protein